MKELMVLALLGLMASQVCGQGLKANEVPAVVKSTFAKAYPAVKEVTWEKEKEAFEAGFQMNKRRILVLLNAGGQILEEETSIAKADLPKTVQNTLAKRYEKYTVKEVAKITAKGVMTYEVEVEMGKEAYDLIFDGTGKLLRKLKKVVKH